MKVDKFPYEHFNNFLEKFLRNKEQYVTNIRDLDLKTNVGIRGQFEKHNEEIGKIKGDSKESNEQRKTLNESFRNTIESLDESQKCILVHAIWLWALPYKYDAKKALKANQYDLSGITLEENLWKEHENISSIGSSGSVRMSIIPKILGLFESVWQTNEEITNEEELTNEKVKKIIKAKICEDKNPCTTFNAILHFLDPDNVEAIVSSSDKEAIVKAFSTIEEVDKNKEIDDKIQKTRLSLTNFIDDFKMKSFYSNGFSRFWKENKDVDDDIKKLQYKKAMMLYGPPGTGKTFEAMELAQTLIGHEFADAFLTTGKKKEIINAFFGKNIFHLQFHVNYTYDDFVAGMVIENGNTQVRKGFIYDVIERANELKKIHDGLPVVVILDETNRTDISRVFGELFSAIEKRGKDIDLSLKIPSKDDSGKIKTDKNGMFAYEPMKINIPDNVYFIGTMNEIDFSLERIDFALRRRFIWVLKTFDEAALKKMLENKVDDNFETNKYISLCKKVNDKVKEKLGKEYLIGHSFFAEIANIMDEMDLNYEEARLMLWNISILPTLEAYCGSMDEGEKKKFIIDCANAFALEYKDEKFVPKTSAPNTSTDTSVNDKTEEKHGNQAAE